ncbi:MAG: triose-phosphate isomerase [Deltaproteobacteria bacterium]|nr:triose-phosphate isomerase [Deltaproteobacteria bacterium]
MHKTAAEARTFVAKLRLSDGVETVLCPPAVLLPVLAAALPPGNPVRLGAQNVHFEAQGAFTGEHSCAMLRDAGATYVVVGHSERRSLFGETDHDVARKAAAALRAGLRPIVCVGERLAERESGATFRVLRAQLTASLAGLGLPSPDPATLVVAYEPVWAIGTGRNATAAQAQEALAFLRDRLAELFGHAWTRGVRLLYGGSATAKNAPELAAQPDVDGFLVGGASLDPAAFGAILAATAAARRGREAG